MKKIYLVYFVIISLLSCRAKDYTEEILVIHQTFEQATVAVSDNDLHDMMRFGPKFPPASAPAFIASDTLKRAGKHLYLATDSLLPIKSFRFGPKNATGALEKLLLANNQHSIYVKLTSKNKTYQIANKLDTSIRHHPDFNGNLSFSHVVFNEDRTQACYYFEQSKLIGESKGWGMGTLVFATKQNGIWVFTRVEEIWIV